MPYGKDTFRDLLSQEEIAKLAKFDWPKDIRKFDPSLYTCSPKEKKPNFVRTFLTGWKEYLDDREDGDQKLAPNNIKLIWSNLGRAFASVLGDVPEEKRVAIYATLLRRYVYSSRTRSEGGWTDEDRVKALQHFPIPGAQTLDQVSETNLIPELEPTPPATGMSLDNSVSQTSDSTPSNVDEPDSLFADVESEIALEGGFDPANDEDARHRVIREIVQRRGQPQFRANVLAAYRNRCAVTKCSVVETLEAAHIRPYNGEHTNDPRNGLLLRADIHLLFDQNLIGVNPKTKKVVLSDKAKKSNLYKNYDDQPLRLPDGPHEHLRPSAMCLEWRWQQFCEANGIGDDPAS